jgi:hypothetical protein
LDSGALSCITKPDYLNRRLFDARWERATNFAPPSAAMNRLAMSNAI